MAIIKVSKENFESEVLNVKGLVLADFNADWCGPCKMLKPVLEELSATKKIVSINVDDEDELAEKYEVSSIPCLVLFKDGKEIDRSIGFKSLEEIEGMFEV